MSAANGGPSRVVAARRTPPSQASQQCPTHAHRPPKSQRRCSSYLLPRSAPSSPSVSPASLSLRWSVAPPYGSRARAHTHPGRRHRRRGTTRPCLRLAEPPYTHARILPVRTHVLPGPLSGASRRPSRWSTGAAPRSPCSKKARRRRASGRRARSVLHCATVRTCIIISCFMQIHRGARGRARRRPPPRWNRRRTRPGGDSKFAPIGARPMEPVRCGSAKQG